MLQLKRILRYTLRSEYASVEKDFLGIHYDLNMLQLKRILKVQSTLVISTSVISNNRLSRRENLVLV